MDDNANFNAFFTIFTAFFMIFNAFITI